MSAEGRLIHSITFRPDGLTEVSYAEDREEVERMALLRTAIFDEMVFAEELDALREIISDLIDEFCVCLRNEDALDARLQQFRSVPQAAGGDEPEKAQRGFDVNDF